MLVAAPEAPARAHDLALVDLDGVAYRGPEAVPHAAASLDAARAAGMGLVFVTNNASREPETVAAQLSGLGIAAEASDVMTAAQAAAALLAEHVDAGAAVLVVGGAGLVTAVRAGGFELVGSADDGPAAVVQGFAPELGWKDLAEAAYAIQRGALHVVSNLDLTLPNERGIAPGNGSLVGAVRAATGKDPVSAGKPQPTMFRLAAERRGARNPLVIGDRLDTDLAGARAAGYVGLHVFTGVNDARDVILAQPQERPSLLGADLRSLHEPHPVPDRGEDGWWVCGTARARVVDGRLELEEGGREAEGDVSVDLVRAACSAAWTAADEGAELDPAHVPVLAVRAP